MMTRHASALKDLERRLPVDDGQAADRAVLTPEAEQSPRSVFETKLYRNIYGCTDIFSVEASDRAGARPLLFQDRGDHALCLARTASLDAATISQAIEALFRIDRLRFLVFEDLRLAGDPVPASLRFHYQNDWILPLGHESGAVPSSLSRRLDQKLRRLERQHADITLTIEPRPGRDLVAQAIEFSRRKIEASGRVYLIDDEEADRLSRLFATIGTAAVLRHGDRPISIDLFIEYEDEAYAFQGGYDAAYAKASPGLLSIRHGVEHFKRRGFRSMHFLWGDGDYKAQLGARKVPLSTLIVPRNRTVWLNRRLLIEAAQFSFLDLKQRVKQHSTIARLLQRMMRWPRKLGSIIQGRG